jgi:outer membrane lipoprotein SlyB
VDEAGRRRSGADNLHAPAKAILGGSDASFRSRDGNNKVNNEERVIMASTGEDDTGTDADTCREASAVFTSAKELQSAIDALLASGFTRDDLSVLGSEKALHAKFGAKIPDAAELADIPDTPRGTFVSSDTRSEGLAALAGIPVYIGGAGAAAIAGVGGAAVLATAGAALGAGLAAGALGLYCAKRMEKRHADQIDKHLDHGGLVLWVRTDDQGEEVKAMQVLRSKDASDLRMHTVTLPSGADAVPFHDAQPDPFLWK